MFSMFLFSFQQEQLQAAQPAQRSLALTLSVHGLPNAPGVVGAQLCDGELLPEGGLVHIRSEFSGPDAQVDDT